MAASKKKAAAEEKAKTPAKATPTKQSPSKGRVSKTKDALAKAKTPASKKAKEDETEESAVSSDEAPSTTTTSEEGGSSGESTVSSEEEDSHPSEGSGELDGRNGTERRAFADNRHRFLRAVKAKDDREQADLLMVAVNELIRRQFLDRTRAAKRRGKLAKESRGSSAGKKSRRVHDEGGEGSARKRRK